MTATPLSAAEFASLMAPLGPFEPAPLLAVGVSGGADSLALALLADAWARKRGGRAVALTVDHGLRPGSAAEAGAVAAWMSARGITHHVLAWTGRKPAADLQAAAREARHRLLEEWCRSAGCLHLLLAHHRDDQSETVLLRLGRGSGVDGLAAMPPLREGGFVRLLRPLLAVPPARLRATLLQAGQEWVEDPSNRDPRFSRARLRARAGDLAAEGLTPARLAATARRMARARDALDRAVAQAAAAMVRLDPAGWALAAPTAFGDLPEEVGLRLLSRLLLAVGGGSYPSRLDRLEALHAVLRSPGTGAARTLSGCRVVPVPGGLLFCREPARVAAAVALEPGRELVWDGRFRLLVADDAPPGLRLGALGASGWTAVRRAMGRAGPPAVPAPARPTLPAILDQDGVSAVPHLGYNRETAAGRALRWIVAAPANPLTVAGRCLV